MSNIPSDETALQKAVTQFDTDATTEDTELTAANAQLSTDNQELASNAVTISTQGSELTADAAEIATLEAELNPPAVPSAPTAVVAVAGSDSATISWTASVAHNTPVTGYLVTTSGVSQTVTGTSVTITGLTGGQAYTFDVVATSSVGNSAAGVSNSVTPTVPAGAEPDMIVAAISIPATITAGTLVTFGATIKNQGNAPTPAGTINGVAFAIDGVEVTWSDTYTASLVAGASTSVKANNGTAGVATWTATKGTHTLVATVNDIHRFTESNFNNNTLSQSFTV